MLRSLVFAPPNGATGFGCHSAGGYHTRMITTLRQIWSEDRGQDIAEYAMMLAVILLTVAATVGAIGNNAKNVFSNAANKLTTG